MNFSDLFNSTKNQISERIFGPMYGSFVIAWCLINWKVLYVTLFISEDALLAKSNLIKIDYIISLYSDRGFILSAAQLLFLPSLITYLIIWWVSRLVTLCYAKDLESQNRRVNLKIRAQAKYLHEQAEFNKAQTTELKTEKAKLEAKKGVQQSKTREEIWDDDFSEFRKIGIYKNFSYIYKSVYQHEGRVKVISYEGSNVFSVPTDIIAYCDTNEIINLVDSGRYITLTDKGKYFIKKFLSLNSDGH